MTSTELSLQQLSDKGYIRLYNKSENVVEYLLERSALSTSLYPTYRIFYRPKTDEVELVYPDYDEYAYVSRENFFAVLKPEVKVEFLYHLDMIQKANRRAGPYY